MPTFNKMFRPVVLQAKKAYRAVVPARRANVVIRIPAFSYNYPAQAAGVSIIVAVYSVPITTPWTIRVPVKPVGNFSVSVKWVAAGVVYRYKLWDTDGAQPDHAYIGEVIPPGAELEIWTGSGRPAVLPADWTLTLGLLELPSQLGNDTGTVLNPTPCVLPFTYDTLSAMIGTCKL